MQTSLELAPGLVSESTLSPRLKRSSDLSVAANMLVARSPASLKRHGAWGSRRAVSSPQQRLANGRLSSALLEPTLGKTRAGENPRASSQRINDRFVLPLVRGKKIERIKTRVASALVHSASSEGSVIERLNARQNSVQKFASTVTKYSYTFDGLSAPPNTVQSSASSVTKYSYKPDGLFTPPNTTKPNHVVRRLHSDPNPLIPPIDRQTPPRPKRIETSTTINKLILKTAILLDVNGYPFTISSLVPGNTMFSEDEETHVSNVWFCLLYTSPSPRD